MQLKEPVISETAFSKYSAFEIIGEGGSGQIFKARDDSANLWAIKLLNPSGQSKESKKRFKYEINFCVQNKHKNIVTIVEYGTNTDIKKGRIAVPFYVMPLYPSTLRDLMRKGIPPEKVLFYFAMILNGIEAAHLKRVIHRDIKPENILHDEIDNNLWSLISALPILKKKCLLQQ